MPAPVTAFVLGSLAGLAVAMPVGPVGVLLLRTGLLHGVRVAAGAAAGIATVDAGYAVLAVVAGAPVSRLATSHADVVRLLSSTVLLAVGVVTLLTWWRTRSPSAPPAPPPSAPGVAAPSAVAVGVNATTAHETHPGGVLPATDRAVGPGADGSPGHPGAAGGGPRGRPAWRAYGTFVGLTAVNPLTAVTFATVAVGLAARVGDRPGAAGAVAFVVGAGVASLAWQLVLAVVSGRLGGRLGPAGRSRASLVGALVVVALAVVVATG